MVKQLLLLSQRTQVQSQAPTSGGSQASVTPVPLYPFPASMGIYILIHRNKYIKNKFKNVLLATLSLALFL